MMERCVRCLEYKEPEEFTSSWYTKKNGEVSTLNVCKKCKALDASIRRYTKKLEMLQPDDAEYQEVKQTLDALMKTEWLYKKKGGKVPRRFTGKKRGLSIEEIKRRNEWLQALILEEKQIVSKGTN